MFKKIKENPYYKKFKEMRADPKLRPITTLILWFIFMAVVVVFVRSMYSTDYTVQTEQEVNEVEAIQNYEFTYTNDTLTVFGECYDGNLIFIVNGGKYYYNGTNVYLVQNQSATLVEGFDLNILKITPSMINSLTENLTYQEYGTYKQYWVPLANFLNLYETDVDVDLTETIQYNIIINVYEDDDGIYMYKLDLSNYYNYRELTDGGILTIDIYDREIDDFTEYYDELIGGVV